MWLVPAARHSFDKPLAPFADRVALLIALMREINDPRVKLCPIEDELLRGGAEKSHTIDTLLALTGRYPGAVFTLALSSDTRAELPTWHRAGELQHLARFHFFPRAGVEDSPFPQVSSTEIRGRLARGESIEDLAPAAVARLIADRKWYGPPR